ncbi:MAG: amidohydrolase family protein, partial [Acidobacteria bacterium]|nr:amidohydrolase family protein [Acidobacteriota bacterium]
MSSLRCAAFACSALLGAACAAEPPPPEPAVQVRSADVVYHGMRVIPGDGSPPVEDAVMIVDGGRIAAVGTADEVAAPAGATTVDLSGKTLIPALINLHGHVGFQRGLTYDAANYTRENIIDELRRYLYHGVGTVVSLGTDAGGLWQEIQRDQQVGSLDGARLYTADRGMAAPNAGPGSPALRPSAAGVTSEEEGRRLVGELAAQRASFVKIWVDDRGGTVEKLAPAFYRAIIDEAHRRGLQVIAHVFYHDDAEDLVAAGVDGFAHLVRDREMDDALVAAIAAQDVFVMPNLGVSERRRHTEPPAWLREPLLASTVAPAVLERAAASYAGFAADAPARAA